MDPRISPARRLTVALIAAYVLVLQAVVGGLAAGHHANVAVLDRAMAQVLCDPSSGGAPVRHGPEQTAHLPDCCTSGCLGVSALGQPVASSIPIAFPEPRPAFRPSRSAFLQVREALAGPTARPRGPPSLA